MQLTLPISPSGRLAPSGRRPTLAHVASRGAWLQRDEAIMGTRARRAVGVRPALGRRGDRRRDGRDAPHRPCLQPAPPRLRAVAAEPRRRVAPGHVSAEMFGLLQRAAGPFRAGPTAPSTSATPPSAGCTTTGAASAPDDATPGPRPGPGRLARHRRWTPPRGGVRFARDGMCIDLGGFAKGHAVDCAAARPAQPRHRARLRQCRR